MCGITAYIGTGNAQQKLIDCLKCLEYRGYDSAGIATLSNNNIRITKSAGKITNLEKIINFDKNSQCGIAHTRWATHGAPTQQNAHPHLSNDQTWAIVHNGIIENYDEIKNQLLSKKYVFNSQTDTEVISNLLQEEKCEKPIQALISATKKLNGSYALAVLNKNYNNTLYLAKNKSPLYIAKGNNEIFVASDIVCFADKFTDYYSLQDNEYCEANANNLTFYDKNGKIIKKKAQLLKNYNISNSKQNYQHYMLKEINEVPTILKNIVSIYKNNKIFEKYNRKFISNFNKIVLIGCGTAYHASLIGAKYLEQFCRIDATAHIASEYRYNNPIIDDKTLCILVSQSGETADTLAVCEMAKKCNAKTIALTNVLYSSLANMSDEILPVCAGSEIAVASTKAYTSQISILYMFAKHLQNEIFNKKRNYYNDILQLSKTSNIPSLAEIDSIAEIVLQHKNVFFIGRNYDYVSALEASLKLKEITYIFATEHPAGELKHGFLALIDEESVLFAIATQKNLLNKTLNGAFEAQSRGAKVIFVSQFDIPQSTAEKFYKIIKLENFKQDIMPISSIYFFQMLAYLTSVKKGLNPDQPRNLAKSVTVE